ncbi:hypothetical protein [Streptomyces naphthomycinicus]|uniref:hypothetical protein n=1 Tax=Streptomyces naphthomycinicus TaxID=2872625 RepID=UPI00288AB69C|nr:hypothetical protein [Streptomyces sp. TML10]
MLADGDSSGYITYDTKHEVLAGYTSDGSEKWRESRYFPTDVHCAGSCPNAVISATPDMNEGESRTHTVWKTGATSTVRSSPSRSLIVHWARDRDTWIATDESSITWSESGRRHTRKFAGGVGDAMGRVSGDGSTLVVSVQTGSAKTWSAYRFRLTGARLSPVLVSDALPGSIGCLSPQRESMWTLGDKAVEYDLATGRKLREVPQFLSDCASSRSTTVLGTFSAGTDEARQTISLAPADRSASLRKTVVNSDGEIGVFRDCGVFLSDGRLTTLSADGKRRPTEIGAHSVLTTPDGLIYSVGPSGEPERHRITADDRHCRVT